MRELRKEATPPSREYSPKRRERAREEGTVIRSARNEVAKVPTTKGRTPNSLVKGFHNLPV